MEQAAEISLEQIGGIENTAQLVKSLSEHGSARLVFRTDEQVVLQGGRDLAIRPGKSVPLDLAPGSEQGVTYREVGTSVAAGGEWVDLDGLPACAMNLDVNFSGVGRAVPGQADAGERATFDSCTTSRMVLVESGRPATLLFSDYPTPGPEGQSQTRVYIVRVRAQLLE